MYRRSYQVFTMVPVIIVLALELAVIAGGEVRFLRRHGAFPLLDVCGRRHVGGIGGPAVGGEKSMLRFSLAAGYFHR